MTPHTNTDPYLLWLDKEIGECSKFYKSSDASEAKYWMGAIDALQVAREKYLLLSSQAKTEPENENNFTDGLI